MTSDQDPRASPLEMLPVEVLLQLMPLLDVSDLKNFRGLRKSLNDVPNSILFRTFYLYPHKPSFEALLHLVEEESIRCHVRRLVYDIRWADLDAQVYTGIKRFYSTTRHFSEIINDLRFETLINEHDEAVITVYLALAFCKLPTLDDIQVLDLQHPFDKRQRDSCRFEQVPEYYRRSVEKIHGQPLVRQTRFRHAIVDGFKPAAVASCVLEAARQVELSVSTLRLVGISSTDVAAQVTIEDIPGRYGLVLARIEDLRIDFGCIPRAKERAALARLPVVLSECTSLVDLYLEFGTIGRDFPDIDAAAPYADVSLFDDMFPDTPPERQRLVNSKCLRSLDLRGFRCTESQFKHLLDGVCTQSPDLAGFCTWDLTIVPESPAGPKGCLVRIIKFLRSLRLGGCRLSGTILITGVQQWVITPPSGLDMLCDKVHEYIDQMGEYEGDDAECPLEYAAIPDGEDDLRIPVEYNDEPTYWRGDASWQMIAPGRPTRNDGCPLDGMLEYIEAGRVLV